MPILRISNFESIANLKRKCLPADVQSWDVPAAEEPKQELIEETPDVTEEKKDEDD